MKIDKRISLAILLTLTFLDISLTLWTIAKSNGILTEGNPISKSIWDTFGWFNGTIVNILLSSSVIAIFNYVEMPRRHDWFPSSTTFFFVIGVIMYPIVLYHNVNIYLDYLTFLRLVGGR